MTAVSIGSQQSEGLVLFCVTLSPNDRGPWLAWWWQCSSLTLNFIIIPRTILSKPLASSRQKMNRRFQPLSISQEVNRIFQSLSLNPRLCEDGTKPLRYTKLKSKGLIRLLQVQPALFNESDLHAFFHEAELESVPPYEAISYTWGSAVLPETLNFPEGHLKITENLASALKKFRFTDKVRFFWADAVCINQEDNVEKGRQVAMMNQIYKTPIMYLSGLEMVIQTVPIQ